MSLTMATESISGSVIAHTAKARDENKQCIAGSIAVVLGVKLGLRGYPYKLDGDADRESVKLCIGASSGDSVSDR